MDKTHIHYRTCNLCEAICGLEIKVKAGEIHTIKGDKNDPLSRGHICPKAVALKDIYEDPDRLKFPLKRTSSGWTQISWDEAFDETVERIKHIQQKYSPNAVGLYQGNPSIHNLGTQLFAPDFARALKTKNRFSATSIDQLPHQLAANFMFGHDTFLPVPDLDRTHFWLILGGNPLVSNGSLMTSPDIGKRMKAIMGRGEVVVVDPRYTETAAKASQHIFVKPGTDVWLLLAMVREVFEHDWVDLKHLHACIASSDIEKLKELCQPFSAELAEEKTGISAGIIRDLIKRFCEAPSAVCYGRLGLSVVEFGGISNWLINVLNIITGNFDVPGGAMFSTAAFDILGRSPGRLRFNRWQSRLRKLPEFGGELPSATLAEEILTEGEGQIRAMVTSAGNPVLSTPNGRQLDRAFSKLDFMVSIDIYLNETTRHADIILPPATGLEVPHYDLFFHTLAVRNTSKFSPALFPKAEGAKYDWEIFLALRKGLQAEALPEDPARRAAILQSYSFTPESILNHGLQKGPYQLSLKQLADSPHGVDLGPLESQLPDKLFTADGKLALVPEIFVEDLARLHKHQAASTHLLLIGRRHLRSNNSWMHNSQRLVKGKERCTLLIHPKDALKRALSDGQIVGVKSRVGELRIPIAISEEIAEGVVSIPHGWGHGRAGIKLKVAEAHAGISVNDLTDHQLVDPLTGNAILNGVAVEVFK